MFIYGPASSKDSDNDLLHDSHLNELLIQSQQNLPNQNSASYGDGIFVVYDLDAEQSLDNEMMIKVRVSNEWAYKATTNAFPYVDWKSHNKIFKDQFVIYRYVIATILRNAKVCLYENQTSRYFDCSPPILEEYFQVM
jgi:hypothetical protein